MATRRIRRSPGVELHEIDRSGYGETVDNSQTGTVVFSMGFADKGPDYKVKWINSRNTFVETYGYPTNEAEKYFYNAAMEILQANGRFYAAKLPYDNESLDKFSYASYKVDTSHLKTIRPVADVVNDGSVKVSGRNILDTMLIKYSSYPVSDISNRYSNLDFLVPEKGGREAAIHQDVFKYLLESCAFSQELYDAVYDFLTQSPDSVAGVEPGKYVFACNLLKFVAGGSNFLESRREILESAKEKFISRFGGNSSTAVQTFYASFLSLLSLEKIQWYYEDIMAAYSAFYKDVLEENRIPFSDTKVYFSKYGDFQTLVSENPYSDLNNLDSTLTSYMEIQSFPNDSQSGLMAMETFDRLKVGETKPENSRIYVVDISRSKYQENTDKPLDTSDPDSSSEYIGVLPVITTAANALYFQKFVDGNSEISPLSYSSISAIRTIRPTDGRTVPVIECVETTTGTARSYDMPFTNVYLASDSSSSETLSKTAAGYFPEINYTSSDKLNPEYLKQIGVVVFKMYASEGDGNKIGFMPVEAFVGSLDRYAKDPKTGARLFIDDVVNDKSSYVNVFSNVEFSKPGEKEYRSVELRRYTDQASIFVASGLTFTSLGFYGSMCKKEISVGKSVYKSMDMILERCKDPNTVNIDLLADAGVSTIAQFVALSNPSQDVNFQKGYFDPESDDISIFRISSEHSTSVWRNVIGKYDSFCKGTRKDCMFLADSPRSFCVEGRYKIVRDTNIRNTVSKNITPNLRYISGVNSSYGAGYCCWFDCYDWYSGSRFWCPPSIKAAGVYVYTDVYGSYWQAPAGVNRAVLANTVDTAFNPDVMQSGQIYDQSWNYAINYPMDGIVIEGQRTFQINKTAFDRVNVRRLFLGLEKQTINVARRFTYELNTEYTRQRFVDDITPIFEDAVDGDGIAEYFIKCDEEINTVETIENHELHVIIAVRPVKTIEFIILNFICTSQSASVTEEVSSLINS